MHILYSCSNYSRKALNAYIFKEPNIKIWDTLYDTKRGTRAKPIWILFHKL